MSETLFQSAYTAVENDLADLEYSMSRLAHHVAKINEIALLSGRPTISFQLSASQIMEALRSLNAKLEAVGYESTQGQSPTTQGD